MRGCYTATVIWVGQGGRICSETIIRFNKFLSSQSLDMGVKEKDSEQAKAGGFWLFLFALVWPRDTSLSWLY